ncbi:uncharacterized protein TRIADDRAFT_56233 [Trichoplax adhaerens]|uniref:Uncharacterized protein n=1 Tax=Trichoplax adhaerens TaxID=10228 RepID=B3RXJ6_TRIAD|nr:hypothetical protein TRIADDRAFT_56233 [Trichoplax adhaerens]EDV24870.1 hypothetical protein TRIADDRAFT_56233 [Trichoplax adhaerens]|eukprot:XP_002112760.1 hypothetical protein TRIADDRAFT_56233 [Trichoplax adhaerens]
MEFSTLIKFIMLLSSTLPLIGVADSKIVVSGNRGRKFHLGLLYGSPNYQFESIAIINTLTEAANVSIFNLFDKSKASYFIPADSSRKVIFDRKLLNKDVGLTNRSVIISSDNDIQVDVYQMHPLSGDGYLALPTNAMGPEYVIATYTPTIASQFLVLAHINSTEIFISFPSETSYLGQTYSRKRMLHVAIPHEHGFFFSSTKDLTGTLIYSNHDLVVIAGNPCTTIPLGVQYCDFLIEQLLPTRQLGRNYLLGNFADRKFGDIYRVVAASPNITTVWINTIQQNLTLPQGSFIEFDIIGSNNTYLSCSQECLVAHFNKGFRTDNVLTDSMMVIVADMEQYRSEYVLSTLPSESSYNIDRLYLNIYISTIYKDGLLLDGVIMKSLQWKEIFINTTVNDSSINYLYTAIAIKPGRHILHHINNSATFGVTQYGYGQATAYGLLAGIKLNFTARYAPRIVQQPRSINITEDKNGFLECNATASPEPIIIWLKNGIDLEADINGTHLKDFHLYGRYNFLRADANDEGQYQCKYTNDVGNAISKIANVFVFRPPDPVRNVEVRNITSFGLNISWLPPEFDGRQPITNYTVRLLNYRNTTLKHPCQFSYIRDGCIIENTATYYSNLTPYTIYYLAIEANNIVGESLSQFIKVWTDEFYPKGQVQNLHALGYNLTTIKITWKPPRYPNGKIGYLVYQWSIYPINGTDTRLNFLYNGTDTYTYTYGLLRNSTRYYQVIPYNIKYSLFDSDIVNGTNFIQAPLGYSQKINGIPALFSIHLTWLPPPVSDRGGVIISYSIKYNSSKWNHNNVTITKSANTSIILHNLIPFMEYKITIKAATAAGYGPESPSLFITTLQAVPSVQPLLQNVSLVNNNTIRMEWETISTRNRRGIILGYYLLLRNTRFGTVENRTINVNEVTTIGKNENLTASNLLYYSSYKVSLQAFTIAGPSPRSIEFDVNTLQSGMRIFLCGLIKM